MWVESLIHAIEDLPCDKGNEVFLEFYSSGQTFKIPFTPEMLSVDENNDLVIDAALN